MSDVGTVTVVVEGEAVEVPPDATVAAALWSLGWRRFRRSVSGEARGPLCAMGVCFECRLTIDGIRERRSCLVPVRQGMEIARHA